MFGYFDLALINFLDFRDYQLFIARLGEKDDRDLYFVGILSSFSIRLSFYNQSRENTKIKMKI